MPDSGLKIPHIHLGVVDYNTAFGLQEFYHAQVVAKKLPGILFSLEHTPTLTLGRQAASDDILMSEEALTRCGIQLVRTDRGGQVTAHNPGQLVVYPILNMASLSCGPKKYVNLLESTVIQYLESFGVQGVRDPERPGVWVNGEKICALGVRIKQRASLHGFALNIENDLDIFKRIVPCGLPSGHVTKLDDLVDHLPPMEDVVERLVHLLARNLDASIWDATLLGDLKCPSELRMIGRELGKG